MISGCNNHRCNDLIELKARGTCTQPKAHTINKYNKVIITSYFFLRERISNIEQTQRTIFQNQDEAQQASKYVQKMP